MNARSRPLRRRSRRWARLTWLSLALAACGEAAAPAPVPEEFDDPFAEVEAKEAGPGDSKAAQTPVAATSAAAGSMNAVAMAASAGPAVGESTDAAAAGGSAGESPAAVAAGVVGPAAGEKRPGKKASAAAKPVTPTPVPDRPPPVPVPEDSPTPTPTPTPAPAPVPAEQPAPVIPPQQRFAGTFRYAGGEAQKQNLEAAIEATASELNALIRGIGRKRLRESNPVREQISITVDGDKISMTFGPGRTVTGRLAGPAVPWTSDSGKPVQVSFGLVKGRLVQTFTADDGGRRSVYTLDETGDRMTLSVTVTSERLTHPLKYALSYRRS